MNSNFLRENRAQLLIFVAIFAFIGLLVMVYVFGSRTPSETDLNAAKNAATTKTAIALTSKALLGPFPTPTGPTPTASFTQRPTSTITLTPTITPTRTPFRFFTETNSPRTKVADSTSPASVVSATPVPPLNTQVQPTNTSVAPTSVPPTAAPPTEGPISTIIPPIIQTLLP